MHFVSAWQMYLAIEALGQGRNPVVASRTGRIDRAGDAIGIR
jgi:hypothetical protein